MTDGDIVRLRSADLAQLQALLHANHLPDDDCGEQVPNFCALYHGDELLAAGGLQPAGEYALLRSIVVRENHRGKGLARRITDYLLQQAEAEGRVAAYLLTESAENYFTRFGFQAVDRSDVPPAISRTRQFSSLCPDSASCLWLSLPRGRSPAG